MEDNYEEVIKAALRYARAALCVRERSLSYERGRTALETVQFLAVTGAYYSALADLAIAERDLILAVQAQEKSE
jgi:hypothetical protein